MTSESILLPGLKHIGMALERTAKPWHEAYGVLQSRLLMDWEKIVGKQLARGSAPGKVVFKAGKRTEGLLYVNIYHSSLATQMMFMQPVILERIATYFGYKAVANLKIQQRPSVLEVHQPVPVLREPALNKSVYQRLFSCVSGVEDAEVREALQRLLNAL